MSDTPTRSGGQPALATTSQRVLPEWDLEGRYKDLSAQRHFIDNDLLWNLLYRQAFVSRGRPISDEEYEEWVWWKKRLITAPSTQKLANHVCGKAGTDRGRLVSWAGIVGVMDKTERSACRLPAAHEQPTASEGSFPDDREATPEMAPPAVPTAAQGLFPPDARASREPSLALTEETVMEESPSYAGHIYRAEHDIRMRHIRERLEGSNA
ncbi:hypothetical protein FIE12Z_2746 [Fusarium flagelliforme]|uniref:Uncharacterized protein n=1 Tax=Fusarium flagelliforme TaxID=2675880 RepID=A0A395MZ81_9HYPO|nr:hypothetical protein FIE12Z_2746 [Fusarium flagelliforme]